MTDLQRWAADVWCQFRELDGVVAEVETALAAAEAEVSRLTTENERLRTHTLDSNPALRTLHNNAVAYLDAVEALSEVRGGPLSTTLAYLIRQGYLVPVEKGQTK